jgi:hypothetical protein
MTSENIQYINSDELYTIDIIPKDDFNYMALSEEWQTKLLTDKFVIKKEKKKRDSLNYIQSMTYLLRSIGLKLSHEKIKQCISRYIRNITEIDFITLLKHYTSEKSLETFHQNWDPLKIKTRRDFIRNITNNNFDFNDYTSLDLLSKSMYIDIVVFDENLYNIRYINNSNKKLIILYKSLLDSQSDFNYSIVSYIKNSGKYITLFKNSHLPKELDLLFNKRRFIIKHLDNILKDEKTIMNLTFNQIVRLLENNLHCTFSKNDIVKLTPLINEHLYQTFNKNLN